MNAGFVVNVSLMDPKGVFSINRLSSSGQVVSSFVYLREQSVTDKSIIVYFLWIASSRVDPCTLLSCGAALTFSQAGSDWVRLPLYI